MSRWKYLAVPVVAIMAVVGLGAAPATAASPAISVTPNTGLLDGQVVNVSGTGYTSGASLAMLECTASPSGQDDCDLSTLVYTNASATGGVSTKYTAFRQLFTTNQPNGVDCAVSPCVFIVANISNQTEAANSPISFDASVPLPPPLQVTPKIDTDATFDKAGRVTIQGTVTCNKKVPVEIDVEVTQRAGRSLYHAYGYRDMTCNGATPFAMTLTADNGLFRGGSATVDLDYYAFSNHPFVSGHVTQAIHLHGGTK